MKRMSILYVFVFSMLLSCGSKKGEPEGQEIFKVRRVDLLDKIVQTGQVEPCLNVELMSEASGRIEKIYVKEGQEVKKGDRILSIDPDRLRNNKQRLYLEVEKAKLEMNIKREEFDDAVSLKKTGSISDQEVSDLKNAYELGRIVYRQKLLEYSDIRDQLAETEVKSPMDGVITSLDVEEGEIAVSATSGFQGGTKIATIADISELEVVSSIGEADYVNLDVGQKVVVRSEAMEGVYTTGTVAFISKSAQRESEDELGTFEVRVEIDSVVKGLAPGIDVAVDFVVLDKKNVLGVPNRFISKNDDISRVYKKEESGSIHPVVIETGDTDYMNIEVLSGLKPGDLIVNKKVSRGEKADRKRRSGK